MVWLSEQSSKDHDRTVDRSRRRVGRDVTDARSRWNARYDTPGAASAPQPAPFVRHLESYLPSSGTAVDIGGGLGANAAWLAGRGLDVTLLDVSDVGLARARRAIEALADAPVIEYLQHDVEAAGLPVVRLWDVALMHLFFDRDVALALPAHVRPGGIMAICQPTVVNLNRHERPGRRFLPEQGEVDEIGENLVGVEVIEASAQWRESGRHDAWLIARRVDDPTM